eukprot:m.237690 g.237690  ORF g.237690 m.237690 type:complete len:58 (-) comp15277_c0_seq5:1539-1712(-)
MLVARSVAYVGGEVDLLRLSMGGEGNAKLRQPLRLFCISLYVFQCASDADLLIAHAS